MYNKSVCVKIYNKIRVYICNHELVNYKVMFVLELKFGIKL